MTKKNPKKKDNKPKSQSHDDVNDGARSDSIAKDETNCEELEYQLCQLVMSTTETETQTKTADQSNETKESTEHRNDGDDDDDDGNGEEEVGVADDILEPGSCCIGPCQDKTDNSTDAKKKRKRKKRQRKPKQPQMENETENETKTEKKTFEEELTYLQKLSPTKYQINIGFVPNMKIPAQVVVNSQLEQLLLEELSQSINNSNGGGGSAGFLPALKQLANVASLPGITKCMAMPDVHSGYGFCIGNVAAFDMDDPNAVISPGGVGFDINCGVRLIRTNLQESDVSGEIRQSLAQKLFDNIPVGVGRGGEIPVTPEDLEEVLLTGIDWALRQGYAWEEDKEHCEENGRMMTADPSKVSERAKKRGLKQLGTLGAGNHYAEVQVVEEVYDAHAAEKMGIGTVGQVCIMIHSGSRGLGHQVATDALQSMERAMVRDGILKHLNDRQLSCAKVSSKEGQDYLKAMSAAANYAWVNRSCMTYLTRRAFASVFGKSAEEMDMHLVYDVCHNVAKIEKHLVEAEDGVDDDGGANEKKLVEKTLLVHRKGSTRAFPPHHSLIPSNYQSTGQPVLIGGTMGTCSYVLVGTDTGMKETFGSTCHGAGRALSRNASRRKLDYNDVLAMLKEKDIAIRVASPKLVTEEAPESYKDVVDVVDTCQDAGISRKVVKLRPIAVVKG